MLDPRFYERLAPISLADLAVLTGAAAPGGDQARVRIEGVASLEDADAACLVVCADGRFAGALAATRAGACLVRAPQAALAPPKCASLVTPWPQSAFAQAVERLVRIRAAGTQEGDIDSTAELEAGVVVSRGATIAAGARIGAGTHVAPGAVIGPGVAIGRDGRIGAGARVGFALVGDRVHIHAGAVVGEAGFGAAAGPRGLVGLPQLGRVILQDNVRVGANSCVDRGAWRDTVVGENTRIDNLVHIAHNVVIGRDCVLAAFTGVSGSCVIGDGCQFGGRAGVIDHITIGAGARIAADSAVMKDVPAGASWGGSPARPVRLWLRQTAWLARAARGGVKDGGEA